MIEVSDSKRAGSGLRDGALNIAIVANSSWYLFNFRSNLIRSLQLAGHYVITIGSRDSHSDRVAAVSSAHCDIVFSGTGTNPFRELSTVIALRRAFRRHKIDVVLSFTPKANVYAALAITGFPARLVANVSGLGRAFASHGFLRTVVQLLYRRTFSRSDWVFFQNDEDRKYFVDRLYVSADRSSRLPGSGVDVSRFMPRPSYGARARAVSTSFLLVARMIWDKGIGEFVEAAKIVRRQRPDAAFRLLGAVEQPGPAAVPLSMLQEWQAAGWIEYLGVTDDVAAHIAEADCVVLPSSYREGVPRSLLEAAAMSTPIIASDSVGCRDAVDDGVSGFLCRPRDAAHLADRMLAFADLPPQERMRMGRAGRIKMVREFDERIVLNCYVDLLAQWTLGLPPISQTPPLDRGRH
jgi:glycosyltransferase involved in cell wall biosynthesis